MLQFTVPRVAGEHKITGLTTSPALCHPALSPDAVNMEATGTFRYSISWQLIQSPKTERVIEKISNPSDVPKPSGSQGNRFVDIGTVVPTGKGSPVNSSLACNSIVPLGGTKLFLPLGQVQTRSSVWFVVISMGMRSIAQERVK